MISSAIERRKMMFTMIKRPAAAVKDRTVYIELYGENRISYRVLCGRIDSHGETVYTYGVEIEDRLNCEKEAIPDFSRSVEDAVHFAESLIACRARPKQIYSKALGFLVVSI